MTALALALLLAASDRPEQVDLVPHAAPAVVFRGEDHPVVVTIAVSAAVVTAVVIIAALVLSTAQHGAGLQFPTTVTCATDGCPPPG